MATICSCLKYFGKVVVGVVRSEDRHILLDLVNTLLPSLLSKLIAYLCILVESY